MHTRVLFLRSDEPLPEEPCRQIPFPRKEKLFFVNSTLPSKEEKKRLATATSFCGELLSIAN